MRGKRIFWFLIMIAVGLAVGLFYGWVISPAKNMDTSPGQLRSDYRADYVLMVAEIYHADGNLAQAAQRLRLLGSQPPAQIVSEGLSTAYALEYPTEDLDLMNQLVQALEKIPGGQP